MGLTNKKYTYDKLGSVNTNGIETALFPQIRDAIADRMKEIYGNDIDLSTASADGQYINMEALIINNIYRLLDNLYMNIDPFTAAGKYLDILCSLTNVRRKAQSNSTAQLYVKNVSAETQTPTDITLIDRNNLTWVWTNPTDITDTPTIAFNSGDIEVLTFTCETSGAVEANGTGASISNPQTDINWTATDFTNTNGDIYKTIDSGIFKVYQAADANIGNDEETDTSLRNRRYSFLGSNSITTQSALESALFNMESIEDVYIYNNVSGDHKVIEDTVDVLEHNVYIVLRYKEGVTVSKNLLATTIYEKMTPGVTTQSASGCTGGTAESATLTLFSGVTSDVCWKICDPVSPEIVLTFKTTSQYIQGSGGTRSIYEQAIIDQLQNYFSNIGINEEIIAGSVLTTMLGADLRYNGQNTFYPLSCTIDGESSYLAPLTYYKYDDSDYVFDYTGATPTLTIGGS